MIGGTPVRVSGSILAVKDNYMDYAKLLRYAHVNCLHVDIFQNGNNYHIEELLKFDDSFLPRDVHLIYETLNEKWDLYIPFMGDSYGQQTDMFYLKDRMLTSTALNYTVGALGNTSNP